MAPFTDDALALMMLSVRAKLAMSYVIFYIVLSFFLNIPVCPNYPNIYQAQKLLNPENSTDLKKIAQFIQFIDIMQITEHGYDWDISVDW